MERGEELSLIEATFHANIKIVRDLFLMDRCIARNIRSYMLIMIDLKQQSVDMVANGRGKVRSSFVRIHSVGYVLTEAFLQKLQSWIISFHIVVTRNSSGVEKTGKHYASHVMIRRL